MKLTWKDGVATLLFALISVTYAGYVIGGSVPFIKDPIGMSALALVLGIVAAIAGGWIVLHEGAGIAYLTGSLGALSAVLGVLALLGQNLFSKSVWDGVLAAFIGSIVLLWGIAIGRHAGLVGSDQPHAPMSMTPA